jgi:hypothetical protein
MFPPTDREKSADDVFPTTDNVKDIKPAGSLHVETVVLITRVEDREPKTLMQQGF